jgi:hypothetical protein
MAPFSVFPPLRDRPSVVIRRRFRWCGASFISLVGVHSNRGNIVTIVTVVTVPLFCSGYVVTIEQVTVCRFVTIVTGRFVTTVTDIVTAKLLKRLVR